MKLFYGGCVTKKRQHRKDGWVPITSVQPLFDRLIAIYGTKAKVAKAMGIPKQGFLNPNKEYIQQKTYNKARELLATHEGIQRPNVNVPLEVVDRHQLALVLRRWVVEYLAQHPLDSFDSTAGPTQVIAERTGKSGRVVSGYINESSDSNSPYVSVTVADELLIAIDETNAFYDGRLPVVANPTLSMELWLARMAQRGCI